MKIQVVIDDKILPEFLEQVKRVVEEALADQLAKARKEMPVIAAPSPRQEETKPTGVDLPYSERLRAADLRTALLLGKIPEDTGLLIEGKMVAKLLNVSYRSVYRLQGLKAIPEPLKVGNLTRWRLSEIIKWIDDGCPSRWQNPLHVKKH